MKRAIHYSSLGFDKSYECNENDYVVHVGGLFTHSNKQTHDDGLDWLKIHMTVIEGLEIELSRAIILQLHFVISGSREVKMEQVVAGAYQ